jgi:hypothetical protein
MGKNFLVVQGSEKSARPKSAGHLWRPKATPDIRKGTLAAGIKILLKSRKFPEGTTQVQWTPPYEAISASFCPAKAGEFFRPLDTV